MAIRTFKLDKPLMQGGDIKGWQQDMLAEFKGMAIDPHIVPLKTDGVYGLSTRSITATLCRCLGINPATAMKNGVTPQLRRRIRDKNLTANELARYKGTEGKMYRAELRHRWDPDTRKLHTPATKILADSWGWHPGVHDGLDVIVPPDAPIFAMVKSKVIDVRASGWWGLGAPRDPKLKAKGDGIIQLEVLEDVGPFRKGMHIGYGHAEKATVRKGQIVEAGAMIGHAGLANAWHIHLMVNDGKTSKGIGNINPERFYRAARNS